MENERKKLDNISSDSSSVLRSIRDEKPLHYTLQIQSFSLLKAALSSSECDKYESQIFNVAGYKWKLVLYPNGHKKRNGSGHISLYLAMADEDVILSTTTSEVNVVFTFLVYHTLRDKYFTVQDGKVRRFHAMKKEWGFDKLVSLETFNDPSNGMLVEDCCAFGVDIVVMNCNDGKGEVLSLIKQPKDYKYAWKVINFSQMNTSCKDSGPFTVENYSWKIRLYPKGDSSEAAGFLSLYLIFDSFKKLPKGFQVYAEYEMVVLSVLETKKVTYKHWFGEEKGQGSAKFISLTDLKEPTKTFLREDTLVVEVKINTIFTLKKYL